MRRFGARRNDEPTSPGMIAPMAAIDHSITNIDLAPAIRRRRFRPIAALIIWHHRHRTRRQLRELDSRQLEDVGIDPSARRCEVAKWFWQS
jgi:uncharacterized protein YjiS (DUF1127 family)